VVSFRGILCNIISYIGENFSPETTYYRRYAEKRLGYDQPCSYATAQGNWNVLLRSTPTLLQILQLKPKELVKEICASQLAEKTCTSDMVQCVDFCMSKVSCTEQNADYSTQELVQTCIKI